MRRFLYLSFISFVWTSISYANDVDESASSLLKAYEEQVYGKYSKKSIEKLLKQTEDLPEKENYPQLMSHYNKAKSFYYMSDKLSDCTTEGKRNLEARYLGQAGLVSANCIQNLRFLDKDLDDFIVDMEDIASSVIEKDIHLHLVDKLADQAVLSLIDHRKKYAIQAKLPSAKELCDKGSISRVEMCSSLYEAKLQEKLDFYNQTINPTPTHSKIEIANNLNALINCLNTNPEECLEELTYPPGTLLLSETLNDKTGGLENIGKKKLKYVNHREISSAISELDDSYIDMIKDLGKKSLLKRVKPVKESLKDIIQASPHLIGVELINNPEYSKMVCSLLGEIEDDDNDSKSFYKWGGIIVGGVLVVGTALTLGGLGVLVAAGGATAVSAGLFTAATVTLTTGGLAAGGLASKQAIEKYSEIKSFEDSILVGAADKETVSELQKELENFYALRTQAIIEFGSSVLGGGILKHLTNTSDLKAFNQLLNEILNNSKILAKLKQLNKSYGPKATAKFMLELLKMPFSAAKGFLSKFNPKKLPRWMYVHSKKFVRSVKSVPRFFFRKRVNPAEARWERVKQFISDPIAGTSGFILRNHQVRGHISLISGAVLGIKVESEVVSDIQDRYEKSASNKVSGVPGAAYVNDFRELSSLDRYEMNKLIIEHDHALLKWKENPEEYPLERIKLLISKGILSKDEARSLTNLAQRAYEKAVEGYPNFIKEYPGYSVTDYLEYIMYELINKVPKFQNLPETKKSFMAQYFNPIIPLGDRNDLELNLEVNELAISTSRSLDTDKELKETSTRQILQLTQEGYYTRVQALLMINQVLDEPEVVRKKFEKMKKILPPHKGYIGTVPDAPRKTSIGILKKPKTTIKDELDLWEIVVNDKRFNLLKEQWYNDEINDLQARTYAEDLIVEYNQLYALSNKWKDEDRLPNNEEIIHLYGLDGTTEPSSLLGFSASAVEGLDWELDDNGVASVDTQKKMLNCLRRSAKYWANYMLIEAELARDDNFDSKRDELVDKYHNDYVSILNECQKD